MAMISNKAKIISALNQSIDVALNAVGVQAVGLVVKNMETGYSDPHPTYNMKGEIVGTHTAIRDTGALMQDVQYEVDTADKSVLIYNTLDYALYVHEGTSKLQGRPYLVDGIKKNKARIQEIFQENIHV